MKKNRFYPTLLATKFFLCACLISNSSNAQITTYAGAGGSGYGGDGGPATNATFSGPTYIAKDAAGNLYITDVGNYRVRKVSTAGYISTIAGTSTSSSTGDGSAATVATLKGPTGVAVDRSGNIYISDATSYKIRKINTSGIISTYAGTGTTGFSGDGGAATAAKFANPFGIAVDTAGNLFVADKGNHRIRKITAAGVISTIAGTGGASFSGDGGPASAANVNAPVNVACDNYGNIYIADQGNQRIRKINASGTISTIAGSGTAGFSGDGGAATAANLNAPLGVATDNSGNLYIGDVSNNRVRMVNTSGVISTFAGIGSAAYSGDGGPATAAYLNAPSGVLTDNMGNVFIADKTNGRIRKVFGPNHAPSFVGGSSQAMTVCQNSSATALDALMKINDSDVGQTETWSVNLAPAHGTLTGFSLTRTSTGGIITPTGLGYAPTSGYSGMDSFKININDGTVTATTTIIVTVSPLPSAGTISGPTSVCEGGAIISLTTTGTGGTWSATNANASVVAAGTVTGTTAGMDTIKYTVTNSCGSAAATYVITINPLPVVPAIAGVDSVMVGSVVTLTNTATGGTWSSAIAGVATVNATGDVTGVAVGTTTISYAITTAGCTGYATLSFRVTPYLSVNALSLAGVGISIYPNPATNNITLSWTQTTTGKAGISIADVKGAIVSNNTIDLSNTGKKQIDLSALATGIYIIKLTTENGTYFEKLEVIK